METYLVKGDWNIDWLSLLVMVENQIQTFFSDFSHFQVEENLKTFFVCPTRYIYPCNLLILTKCC